MHTNESISHILNQDKFNHYTNLPSSLIKSDYDLADIIENKVMSKYINSNSGNISNKNLIMQNKNTLHSIIKTSSDDLNYFTGKNFYSKSNFYKETNPSTMTNYRFPAHIAQNSESLNDKLDNDKAYLLQTNNIFNDFNLKNYNKTLKANNKTTIKENSRTIDNSDTDYLKKNKQSTKILYDKDLNSLNSNHQENDNSERKYFHPPLENKYSTNSLNFSIRKSHDDTNIIYSNTHLPNLEDHEKIDLENNTNNNFFNSTNNNKRNRAVKFDSNKNVVVKKKTTKYLPKFNNIEENIYRSLGSQNVDFLKSTSSNNLNKEFFTNNTKQRVSLYDLTKKTSNNESTKNNKSTGTLSNKVFNKTDKDDKEKIKCTADFSKINNLNDVIFAHSTNYHNIKKKKMPSNSVVVDQRKQNKPYIARNNNQKDKEEFDLVSFNNSSILDASILLNDKEKNNTLNSQREKNNNNNNLFSSKKDQGYQTFHNPSSNKISINLSQFKKESNMVTNRNLKVSETKFGLTIDFKLSNKNKFINKKENNNENIFILEDEHLNSIVDLPDNKIALFDKENLFYGSKLKSKSTSSNFNIMQSQKRLTKTSMILNSQKKSQNVSRKETSMSKMSKNQHSKNTSKILSQNTSKDLSVFNNLPKNKDELNEEKKEVFRRLSNAVIFNLQLNGEMASKVKQYKNDYEMNKLRDSIVDTYKTFENNNGDRNSVNYAYKKHDHNNNEAYLKEDKIKDTNSTSNFILDRKNQELEFTNILKLWEFVLFQATTKPYKSSIFVSDKPDHLKFLLIFDNPIEMIKTKIVKGIIIDKCKYINLTGIDLIEKINFLLENNVKFKALFNLQGEPIYDMEDFHCQGENIFYISQFKSLRMKQEKAILELIDFEDMLIVFNKPLSYTNTDRYFKLDLNSNNSHSVFNYMTVSKARRKYNSVFKNKYDDNLTNKIKEVNSLANTINSKRNSESSKYLNINNESNYYNNKNILKSSLNNTANNKEKMQSRYSLQSFDINRNTKSSLNKLEMILNPNKKLSLKNQISTLKDFATIQYNKEIKLTNAFDSIAESTQENNKEKNDTDIKNNNNNIDLSTQLNKSLFSNSMNTNPELQAIYNRLDKFQIYLPSEMLSIVINKTKFYSLSKVNLSLNKKDIQKNKKEKLTSDQNIIFSSNKVQSASEIIKNINVFKHIPKNTFFDLITKYSVLKRLFSHQKNPMDQVYLIDKKDKTNNKNRFGELPNISNPKDKEKLIEGITFDAFYHGIPQMSVEQEGLVRKIYEALKRKNEPLLQMKEFIEGMNMIMQPDFEKKLDFFFKIIDTDNSGTLSYDEVKTISIISLKRNIVNNEEELLEYQSAIEDLADYFAINIFKVAGIGLKDEINLKVLKRCVTDPENRRIMEMFCGSDNFISNVPNNK